MTRDTRSGFIELVEEQLEIGKREVERGRVVVRTRVEERDEIAAIELRQDEVTVERIPRGVPVETTPTVREEDGVLIVPVVEEQLVVTTRLILKEEDSDHPAKPHRGRSRAGAPPLRAGGHRAAGRPCHHSSQP